MRFYLCALSAGCAHAFVQPSAALSRGGLVSSRGLSMTSSPRANQAPDFASVEFADIERDFEESKPRNLRRAVGAAGAALLPSVVGVSQASAIKGEYGIFEGRTASFIHPIIMAAMFLVTGYAGVLGLQWEELRTSGAKITALKAALPTLASTGKKASSPVAEEAKKLKAELDGLSAEEESKAANLKADLKLLESAAVRELDTCIVDATERRKELAKKDVRDKHYAVGSLLLGLGTFAAIEGPVNTYLRAGKLFPGPHLYAGAGIVVGWAFAASLVPAMSKGSDTARLLHKVANGGIALFFAWQVLTGLEIAVKVWEFTKWP